MFPLFFFLLPHSFLHRVLVGNLIYITITKPDICMGRAKAQQAWAVARVLAGKKIAFLEVSLGQN
jgi:hypothetical protein